MSMLVGPPTLSGAACRSPPHRDEKHHQRTVGPYVRQAVWTASNYSGLFGSRSGSGRSVTTGRPSGLRTRRFAA